MPRPKLRLLCLHSFRTSATIFKEQMRRSGLDKHLEDLAEFVYLDAPHEATGPPPPDVAPFFEGPYREWWNRVNVADGTPRFLGGETTLRFVEDALQKQGPFHGLWGFSQGTILATLLLAFQRQGDMLAGHPPIQFAVMFGAVFDPTQLDSNPLMADIRQSMKQGGPFQIPSVHIWGERDPIRKSSQALSEQFKDPLVINHPRGHNIPALDGHKLKQLRDFLEFMQPAEACNSMRSQQSNL